jgi:V/A-type H+-transporting ATPase subunit E
MDVKIQELTDKIYREGVEKGKEEADRLISEANVQKQAILKEAEETARQIVEKAEKQAAELKKNTEAELKLFAAQSVEALKSDVANLITGRVVSENIKPVVADKTFMQQVILEIAREWAKQGGLTVQMADAQALTAYFEGNAKEWLDRGVQIEKVNGKDTSFTIVPADGSYKVTFGEEEFVAFFQEFLRPQLVEILFRYE